MKTTKSITRLLAGLASNFVLALLLGVAVSQFIEVPLLAFAATLTGVSFAVQLVGHSLGFKAGGFAFMALQTEVWIQDIQENLFPVNSFMEYATDHSQFVNHLTVHIPQAGSNPTVYKNATSLPLAINQRTDSDFTYSLNNYKGEPRLVTNLEELQISYDKRSSVMNNYYKQLGYAIANNTLYGWAPSGASRITRTTGSAVATALAPSATGTRNAITLADVIGLKAILDNDNVPAEGRILCIPADMYNNQLLAISNIQQYYAYNLPVAQDGKVPTLFGFKVIVRPQVLVYDTTPVPKSVGADGTPSSPTTTDNLAVLAYHPDFVSKAMGAINVYAQENVPQYFGSILSAEVQHGASPLRSTYVGIAALVQA